MNDFCKQLLGHPPSLPFIIESIFKMIESHNLFIDDPKLLLSTALGLRDCIKMPSVRGIRYLRYKVWQEEIAQKIVTKESVRSETTFKDCVVRICGNGSPREDQDER